MLHYIRHRLLIGLTISSMIFTSDLVIGQNVQANGNTGWNRIECSQVDGLQPVIDFILDHNAINFYPPRNGWEIDIALASQTNFPARTWLKVTNYVGSKLELWQTNGVQIISTNATILGAFHLPKQTKVSEILSHSFSPRNQRAYQWWLVGHPANEWSSDYTANFMLESAFDISLTNDYVLQITPLIYKVETNGVTAHLVEFPPIKVKLMANGNVQKLK